MRPLLLLLPLAACGTDPLPADPEDAVIGPAGRCLYVNSFSRNDECKEYVGAAWTEASMAEDCAAPLPGAAAGTLELAVGCDRTSIFGECLIDAGGEEAATLVFPGQPGDSCGGLDLGCTFAGGEFAPSALCDEEGGPVVAGEVFRPFEQVCREPLAGEPEGLGPDGQVCTWQAISGATEAGRRFEDYAECDVVVTQRPYWAATATADTPANDPRLTDSAWQAEYAWATEQVQASACVCCHSAEIAPEGPSGWHLEAEPIWLDTVDDDGLAMLAGWVDSTAFGAFHADDNNGFDRSVTGLPTTDPARMQDFLAGELARRGFTAADFSDTPPFGGPLYDQLVYEAGACDAGVGVLADGTIAWRGGGARYVYVLEPDASPPGVPPNLDLPEGTLWRLDVAPTADPLTTGLAYGSVPAGTTQRWPAQGAAPALTSGQTYYLYVLADIYQPVTRCLFVAP